MESFNEGKEEFICKVASNTAEACRLTEDGFTYVTEEYHDGGKIFRKPKYSVDSVVELGMGIEPIYSSSAGCRLNHSATPARSL